MKVLIKTKLSEHKYKTPEGYLVCQDAILARTGAQEYYKSEIYETFEGEDDVILVYRNPEQVFAPATLASFEDKPITVEHPDQSVTPENYKDLAVGHTRNVRKGKFNNQDVMIADLIITDAETIKDIESGVRTDLSCGYDCDITDGDKPEQINIRGNHVALCEQGRAGIARIIDSKIKDSDYKGYSIQIKSDGAYVVKNNKVLVKTETEEAAKEWIDDLEKQKEKAEEVKSYTVDYVNSADKSATTVVSATSVSEARKKVLKNPDVFRIVNVRENKTVETVLDSAVLPAQEKSKISNYLSSISKYTKEDKDIFDVIEPLKSMGFDLVREDIKGWHQLPDGRYRKDYFFKVNGYKDIFMISFYTNNDGKWNVNEINAYFTGKTKSVDNKPKSINRNKYVIFKSDGKLKGSTYNNYYLYGNPDNFDDYSKFNSVEALTEYLIDNKDIKRENIIFVKDAFKYKKPASINKAKLKELNKLLKSVNNDTVNDDEKEEMINHQKYKIKEKILEQIKKTESEIEENADNGLDTNISKWYNENFDEVKINEDITFNDLFDTLDNKESVYDLLGIDNETGYKVVKNCLVKLAELINSPYDYVYEQWISYED